MRNLLDKHTFVFYDKIIGLKELLGKKEDTANRKQDLTSNSDSYYPTVKATKKYVDDKITDMINSGLILKILEFETKDEDFVAFVNVGEENEEVAYPVLINETVVEYGEVPNNNKIYIIENVLLYNKDELEETYIIDVPENSTAYTLNISLIDNNKNLNSYKPFLYIRFTDTASSDVQAVSGLKGLVLYYELDLPCEYDGETLLNPVWDVRTNQE